MVQTAIQLYTLRDLPGSFKSMLERVADAGFDGVEFAYRVTDEDPDGVAAILDETGLAVAGAHVPYESLVDDYTETTEFYATIGCDRIVVPAFDEERFESPAAVADAADDLTALGDKLAEDGLALGYHNHGHEFVRHGDRTAYEILIEEAGSSVDFEFDAGLACHVGEDPIEYLDLLEGRVPTMHFTDTVIGDDTQLHADFGTGDLDIESVADAARDAGVSWFIYENGVHNDPDAQLAHAAETFVGRWD